LCPEVPNNKHQITNKFQAPNHKVQTRTKKTNIKFQTRRRNQKQSKSPNKIRLFPRLGFAVLLFGPCLLFGACYLELIRHLMRERVFSPVKTELPPYHVIRGSAAGAGLFESV
jgi:hypothetical protein